MSGRDVERKSAEIEEVSYLPLDALQTLRERVVFVVSHDASDVCELGMKSTRPVTLMLAEPVGTERCCGGEAGQFLVWHGSIT